MIDQIIAWDKALFIHIHNGLASPYLDTFMLFIREAKTWIPLYLLFAFLAIKKYKLNGLYFILLTAVVVILGDRFSAGFMKPFFERLRPCHNPEFLAEGFIRNLLNCGGLYGFISSHATNHFGLAVLFTWFFKQIQSHSFTNWVFYLWAGLISFAQVYVGKHYPADVLVGAIFGILIGFLILKIYIRFLPVDKQITKVH
jgi:undecaprenyl-diphosphatase